MDKWTPVVATFSPCCRVLREGQQKPEVMHSGLCREKHGGELGPTVYLGVIGQHSAPSAEPKET